MVHKLPSLRFLDAQPINMNERTRSFHTGHIALTYLRKNQNLVTKPDIEALIDDYCRETSKSEDQADFANIVPKSAFGRLKFGYSGKHSEGNRFITDLDL